MNKKVVILLISVVVSSFSACGSKAVEPSGSSDNNTSVTKSETVENSSQTETISEIDDSQNPLIGGWRTGEFDNGSDDDQNSNPLVIVINEDGDFMLSYEEPGHCRYADNCLYRDFDYADAPELKYFRYSIEPAGSGYMLRPEAVCWNGTEFDFKEVENTNIPEDEYKERLDKINKREYPSVRKGPSYKLIPYDGAFESALDEYEMSMKIDEHLTMNITAKNIYSEIADYLVDNGLDSSSYKNITGIFTTGDKSSEMEKRISEILSDVDKEIVYCVGIEQNEKTGEDFYFVQARTKDGNVMGQYPGSVNITWENTIILSKEVFGKYQDLSSDPGNE